MPFSERSEVIHSGMHPEVLTSMRDVSGGRIFLPRGGLVSERSLVRHMMFPSKVTRKVSSSLS